MSFFGEGFYQPNPFPSFGTSFDERGPINVYDPPTPFGSGDEIGVVGNDSLTKFDKTIICNKYPNQFIQEDNAKLVSLINDKPKMGHFLFGLKKKTTKISNYKYMGYDLFQFNHMQKLCKDFAMDYIKKHTSHNTRWNILKDYITDYWYSTSKLNNNKNLLGVNYNESPENILKGIFDIQYDYRKDVKEKVVGNVHHFDIYFEASLPYEELLITFALESGILDAYYKENVDGKKDALKDHFELQDINNEELIAQLKAIDWGIFYCFSIPIMEKLCIYHGIGNTVEIAQKNYRLIQKIINCRYDGRHDETFLYCPSQDKNDKISLYFYRYNGSEVKLMMWNSYTKEKELFELIKRTYNKGEYNNEKDFFNFQIKRSHHLCTVDHGGYKRNELSPTQYLGIQAVVKSSYAEKNRMKVVGKITKVCFI